MNENITSVFNVEANDPESQTLTYSISGGLDAAKFNINSSTGLLSFKTAPNFEAPQDADLNNIYNVIVRVTDGLNNVTQTVDVEVKDVIEGAPLFSPDADNVNFNTIPNINVYLGDKYNALGGNDVVILPNAATKPIGYSESNTFFGGDGNDQITGGDLNDIIYGGNGSDILQGGAGADSLDGSNQSATIPAQLVQEIADTNTDFNRTNFVRDTTIGTSTLTLNDSRIDSIITEIARSNAGTLTGSLLANPDEFTDQTVSAVRVEGNLFSVTDIDLYKISLNAGEILNVDVDNATMTLGDSFLLLYNANGVLVAYNDDNFSGDTGSTRDSLLKYTVPVSGDYYIRIESYSDSHLGNYRMNISITENDTVSYADSSEGVTVDLSLTTAQISSGDANSDVLANFQHIIGSVHDDRLAGTSGNNIINGNDGSDTVSYVNATSAVNISLSTATAQNTSGAGTDTLLNIENIIGSNFNDTLSGNTGNNIIDGAAGINRVRYSSVATALNINLTSRIATGAGTDSLINIQNITSGSGNDTLIGNSENNNINGGLGTDTVSYATASNAVNVNLTTNTATGDGTDTLSSIENIIGSIFNDTLTGNSSSNDINGGADIDTISYANVNNAVNVNLSTGTATGHGTDTLSAIENIIGTNFDDTLTGDNFNNIITSGYGRNILQGGEGNDTLLGSIKIATPELGGFAQLVQEATEDTSITQANYARGSINSSIDTIISTMPEAIKTIDRDNDVGLLQDSSLGNLEEFNDQTAPAVRLEGNITSGDIDLYKIYLNANETLRLDVDNLNVLATKLIDSFLILYNSAGQEVIGNDDSPTDTGSNSSANSLLNYIASTSGDYYIRIEGYSSSSIGNYRINVSLTPPSDKAIFFR